MTGLIILWTAVLGACVGSFTNVVVWRLPRRESVVHPGSHCPRCGHAIRWHDNIPVFGWLLLGGRCRDCQSTISWRYPAIEALSSLLWCSALLVVVPNGGGNLPSEWLPWAGFPLIGLLLPLTLIDLDHLWLPEPLCRWGLVTGLLISSAGGVTLLSHHLIAAIAGLLALEGISALGEKALGQPALGLGDAKLAALGGAWLGGAGLTMALGLAVLSGALVGSLGRLSGRLGPRQPFAFGPFIALGIWLVWLHGPLWWWQRWMDLTGSLI